MTETQWHESRDPEAMLYCLSFASHREPSVGEPPSIRKLRQFACACCRTAWHLLLDERSRAAVAAAEQNADTDMSGDCLPFSYSAEQAVGDLQEWPQRIVARAAYHATCIRRIPFPARPLNPVEEPHWFALILKTAKDARVGLAISSSREAMEERVRIEGNHQCILFRDIFPNPFRPPPTLDPAWLRWRDATIPRLAQQMYDARDFASMPILADALEEAGCTSGDILEHCRGLGPHVRGCWVVDLMLGKE